MKKEGIEFVIDSQKIGDDEKSKEFKLAIIKDFLKNLDERKELEIGELAVAIEGPYTNIGMMVIGFKDDGVVRVVPAPNMPEIEMRASDLWHFDDFDAGLKKALIEEQIFKSEDLQ